MTEHGHDNSESDQGEDDASRLTSENTKINARQDSRSIRTLASITELSTSLPTVGRSGQDGNKADQLRSISRDSTYNYSREGDYARTVTFSGRTKKTNQNFRSRKLECGELLTAKDRHEWWSELDPASRKPPPLEELKVVWWNRWQTKLRAEKKRKRRRGARYRMRWVAQRRVGGRRIRANRIRRRLGRGANHQTGRTRQRRLRCQA